MSTGFIVAVMIVTAIGVIYWIFIGERLQRNMLNPPQKKEIKAVLFDLDGVLIESFGAWHETINRVRKNHQLKPFSEAEYRKKGWAKPIAVSINELVPGKNSTIVTNEAKKIFETKLQKVTLLPNAQETLKEIKKRGYKLGLVTNNYRILTTKTIKKYKLDYFDAVITIDDVKKPKPYPDSILKGCKNLKVKPEEVIFIGDTKSDYKAGKSAGATVIGLNTKGDLIISDVKDVLQLLKSNRPKL